jgi:hypothetical protein
MNGNYLIPANSKRSQLFFGLFNTFDLILFAIGIASSAILMVVLPIENFNMALLSIVPGCVIGLLVFPLPNYHNVLTALISMFKFFTTRRTFIWKGWCARDEYK